MGQNVVGHFDTLADAESALQGLRELGLTDEAVSLIPQNTSPVESAQSMALASEATEEARAERADLPEAEVDVATHGTQGRGGYIIVRAGADDVAQRAIEIMERFNAVEIEGRGQEYGPGDWSHVDEQPARPTRRARMYG